MKKFIKMHVKIFIYVKFLHDILEFKYILKRNSYTSFNKLIWEMFKRIAYVCVMYRGVAYYVILQRQGVWRLREAPSGVQGQSPAWGVSPAPLSDFEQFRVYLGPVLLQNSHKNMSQLCTIVHS